MNTTIKLYSNITRVHLSFGRVGTNNKNIPESSPIHHLNYKYYEIDSFLSIESRYVQFHHRQGHLKITYWRNLTLFSILVSYLNWDLYSNLDLYSFLKVGFIGHIDDKVKIVASKLNGCVIINF